MSHIVSLRIARIGLSAVTYLVFASSAWLRPTSTMDARMLKFGAQIDF